MKKNYMTKNLLKIIGMTTALAIPVILNPYSPSESASCKINYLEKSRQKNREEILYCEKYLEGLRADTSLANKTIRFFEERVNNTENKYSKERIKLYQTELKKSRKSLEEKNAEMKKISKRIKYLSGRLED